MKLMMREVRRVTHFDPKTEDELRELERRDPAQGAVMRERARMRKHGHDVIDLKCGHTLIRVRPNKIHLWVKIGCEQCTVRETAMAEHFAAGEGRRQRQQAEAEALAISVGAEVMSKKQSKKEAAARTWNQSYVFKRALKLEPTGAIAATIYKAVRQVKRGTASEITDAANKLGLNKQTKQDPRGMVLSLLRQFAEKGAIEIVRDGEKAAAAPAKAKAKTGKKKVRLIVKEAAASGDSASA